MTNPLCYLQNLNESLISTVTPQTGNEYGWAYLYSELPDGFYQIVIQGIRPISAESSGVALDDVYISSCSEFRKTQWQNIKLH